MKHVLIVVQPVPEFFSSCKTETLYPLNNSTFISIFIFKSSLEMTYAFLWFITWYLRVVEIPRTGRTPKVSAQVIFANRPSSGPSIGSSVSNEKSVEKCHRWGPEPQTSLSSLKCQFRFYFLPLHLNVNCKSFQMCKKVEIIVPWSFMYVPLRVKN